VERWLRGQPDRIICNSAAVAARFGGPGPRVLVIRNGVPLTRFHPGGGGSAVRLALDLGPEDIAVGMVGNFSVCKRHDLFLQAAASLRPDAHRTRFLIAGGEVFPANRGRDARLRMEVRRLGLDDRVRFLGVRHDMPAVMNALDILVSPGQFEACSRAILEAMAAGVPVVGAHEGGNPELIVSGETGVLFPSGDAPALTRALQGLIGNPSLRKAMGEAARTRVEAAFGIERQVQETEAAYEAVLRDP
jgi:glycosyltransferase involved in cell wall biosynthesis